MRISRHYPPTSKLYFVCSNILTFLWRVTIIHFARVSTVKQQKCAHKQLMELRERKDELSNSNETISKPDIRSIQEMESKLLKIRDSDIVVNNIEDDELTDIAMKFEKVSNGFLTVLNFLIVKPIIFTIKYLWKYFYIMTSVICEEIVEYFNKKEMKKKLLSKMIPVDNDEHLNITTV
jgi:hypothetical protein